MNKRFKMVQKEKLDKNICCLQDYLKRKRKNIYLFSRNLKMSDVRADIKVQTMIYDLFGLVTAEGQCFETKNYTAAFSKTSEV